MASNFQQFFGGGSGLTTHLKGTFKYPAGIGDKITLEADGEFGLSSDPSAKQLGVRGSPGNYDFIPLFAAKTSNNNNLVIYVRRSTAQAPYYAVFNEDFTSVVTTPRSIPSSNSCQGESFSPSFAYDPVNDILACASPAGGSNCDFRFFEYDTGTNLLSGHGSSYVINPSGSNTPVLCSICFDSFRSKFVGLSYRATTTDGPVVVTFDSATGVEDGRITTSRSGVSGYRIGYIAYDSVNDCVYTVLDGGSASSILFRKFSYDAVDTRYEEDGAESSSSSGSNAQMMQDPHLANAYVVNGELCFMTMRTHNRFYLNSRTVNGSGFTGGISILATDTYYNQGDYTSVIAPFGDQILYLGDSGPALDVWRLTIWNPATGASTNHDVSGVLSLTSNSFPAVLTPGEAKVVLTEVDVSTSPDENNHYIFSGIGAFLSSGLEIGRASQAIATANTNGDVTLNADLIGLLVNASNASSSKGIKKADGALVVSDTQDLKPLTPPVKKKKTYISNPASISSGSVTTIFSASGFSGKIIGIGLIPDSTSPSFVSLTQTIDSFSEESMGVTSLFASSSSSLPLGNSSSGFGLGVIPTSIGFENAITIKGQLNTSQSGRAFLVIEVDREVYP